MHEQVLNFFHVNFDHLHGDFVTYIRVSLSIDLFEKLHTRNRDNSSIARVTENRVGLACTSLTVGEDSIVKTSPGLFQYGSTEKVPNFFLVCVLAARSWSRVAIGLCLKTVM